MNSRFEGSLLGLIGVNILDWGIFNGQKVKG